MQQINTNTDADGDLDFLKVVNSLKSYYRFEIKINISIAAVEDAVNLAYEHNAHYPRAYALAVLKGEGYE